MTGRAGEVATLSVADAVDRLRSADAGSQPVFDLSRHRHDAARQEPLQDDVEAEVAGHSQPGHPAEGLGAPVLGGDEGYAAERREDAEGARGRHRPLPRLGSVGAAVLVVVLVLERLHVRAQVIDIWH